MANGVMVVAEHNNGKLRKVTLELLGLGMILSEELGKGLTACLIGKDSDDIAVELGKYGAEKVYMCDGELFDAYSPDAYAAAVAACTKMADPALVLIGATSPGKDMSPRAAIKLKTGLASDCVDVSVIEGKIICKRPVYSGKCYARTEAVTSPAMAAVRPNTYPVPDEMGASSEVIKVDPGISEAKAKVKELTPVGGDRVELTEAGVILSGGRGLKSSDNFKKLEPLADLLNAAIGASRAAVDSGYADVSQQVGQTGKVVNPSLYVAFGISGAVQHFAGMRTSKVLVAVNKDEEAPIFEKADYGIVDDLFKVLPVMEEEIRKILEE
ncbi:MAG: electron transfer flavoprotein subunit alpha/FixB family protein [Desulfobacterales bacterium]|nr:electron transfer flavoprotein subunit alpha/FixB family protein [Desulfobacterales bacterium]